MRRKEIMGLMVFCAESGEPLGVVKELMLSKSEFKVEFYILTTDDDEISFLLPFGDNTFDVDSMTSDKKDGMIKMGTFFFNNEDKYKEVIFCGKDVINENKEDVGTIIDYSFDTDSGKLEKIYYYNYKTEESNEIRIDEITENNINNISFGKGEKKEIVSETIAEAIDIKLDKQETKTINKDLKSKIADEQKKFKEALLDAISKEFDKLSGEFLNNIKETENSNKGKSTEKPKEEKVIKEKPKKSVIPTSSEYDKILEERKEEIDRLFNKDNDKKKTII